ncbi:MAG TPA: glycosyltransferase family 4 protein [Vicinamibacterales bacterium]
MRVLYLYPSLIEGDMQLVLAGKAPTDRLYGLVELRRLGHQVDVADSRFRGRFGRLVKRLRQYAFNICDLETLRQIRRYDAVVVKDEFSPMITAACRLAGVKVVYVDALMQLPRRRMKRLLIRANLTAADGVVAYSRTQMGLWCREFGLAPDTITFLPYTIDVDFYRPVVPAGPPARPYVLSVGRDPGRDFATLLAAMEGLDIDLKLVTVPYLLKGLDTARPQVSVLQRLPYEELFRLYAGATAAIIPLKGAVTYPSGIRGLLEAMALGCPAIAARTPVLEEYAREGEGVLYVNPGDPAALRTAIARLVTSPDARASLAGRGSAAVRSRYTMDVFARGLEGLLTRLS